MKILLIALLGSCLRAEEILLTFDVRLNAKFDVATLTYDPVFEEAEVAVRARFYDHVQAIEKYPEDTLILFGSPMFASPLTGHLPYGPPGVRINPPPTNRVALMSAFDFGPPPNQGSKFSLQQHQDDDDGSDRFYSYYFVLSGPNYPPLESVDSFQGEDLQNYLRRLQLDSAQFYFSEGTIHFEMSTMTYLGGTIYSGTATISTIDVVPEPSSLAMWCVVLTGTLFRVQCGKCSLTRRKMAFSKMRRTRRSRKP